MDCEGSKSLGLAQKRAVRQEMAAVRELLIEEVQNHPRIWHPCRKSDAYEFDIHWETIHKALNLPISKRKLRRLWYAARRHYIEMIFDKTTTRSNVAPKWLFFHDMSFLYDYTKKIVMKRTGGMSVPTFLPVIRAQGMPPPCPCCLPADVAYDISLSEPKNSVTQQQGNLLSPHSAKQVDNTNQVQHKLSGIPNNWSTEQQTNHTSKEFTLLESTKQVNDNAMSESTMQDQHEQSERIPKTSQSDMIHNPEKSEPIAYIDLIDYQGDDISCHENGSEFSDTTYIDISMNNDFNIEDLDKLKDYEGEVLFFSETENVICIDD